MKNLLFSFIATVIATTFVCCSGEDYEMYEGGISSYAAQTRSMGNENYTNPPTPPVNPPRHEEIDTIHDSIWAWPDFSDRIIAYQSASYDIVITVSCEGKMFFNELKPQANAEFENLYGVASKIDPVVCDCWVSAGNIHVLYNYGILLEGVHERWIYYYGKEEMVPYSQVYIKNPFKP